MKRALPLALILAAGCAPRPHLYRNTAEAQTGIPHYDVKAVEWALSDVKYLKDHTAQDEWRSCDETLKLGYGDCDDYAVCAYDMTASWPSCDARILVVEGRQARHAITTLKCPGIDGYFDNGQWMNESPKAFGKKVLAIRIGGFLLPAYDWKDVGEDK